MNETLTPVQQAEAARQTIGVLRRMQGRYADGRWCRGARFGRDGRNCLVGGIDEATRWTIPGVNRQIAIELAVGLPRPLQPLARIRPRLALALFNDTVGGRDGAARLVDDAIERLVGPGVHTPVPAREAELAPA